jgi:hypothetical protein
LGIKYMSVWQHNSFLPLLLVFTSSIKGYVLKLDKHGTCKLDICIFIRSSPSLTTVKTCMSLCFCFSKQQLVMLVGPEVWEMVCVSG